MDMLVSEARMLCDTLLHILYRMDLPWEHPDAYNDAWRDRVEALLERAYRRYERRLRLSLMGA